MTLKDAAIVDMRGIAAADVARIDLVQNVRTVVLDAGNAEAFMRIPRVDVRSHLIIQPDERLYTGQIPFDDDWLRDMGDGTRAVCLGQLLIERFTPALFLQKVHRLRMYGQVLSADPVSTGALLSRLERLQGQILPMPSNAWRWIGATSLDLERLQAIASRPVVSIGPITIDPRLSAADIANAISSMTQIGDVTGRDELVCALLSRCQVRLGGLSISQEQSRPAAHPALRVVRA